MRANSDPKVAHLPTRGKLQQAGSVTNNKGTLTPLWVISLFITLTEVMAGIAVVKASGAVQVALTAFVIAFPTAVTAAFFFVLWKRPYVLYPPTEFGPHTDVTEYVEAMQRSQSNEGRIRDIIHESIRATIESPEALARITTSTKHSALELRNELSHLRKELSAAAIVHAEERYISVDIYSVTRRTSPSVFPYDPSTLVSEFIVEVWWQISEYIAPYTYGEMWVLRDKLSGVSFFDVGRAWSNKAGLQADNRTLSLVGFEGGQRLEVVDLRSKG